MQNKKNNNNNNNNNNNKTIKKNSNKNKKHKHNMSTMHTQYMRADNTRTNTLTDRQAGSDTAIRLFLVGVADQRRGKR